MSISARTPAQLSVHTTTRKTHTKYVSNRHTLVLNHFLFFFIFFDFAQHAQSIHCRVCSGVPAAAAMNVHITAQTFFVDEDIQKLARLDGIITLVDAKHILPRLDEIKPEVGAVMH
jgi:hypothetical protein